MIAASIVRCNNGSNFIGFANGFPIMDFEKIFHKTREGLIPWKFISPNVPLWEDQRERLEEMMKIILRKYLGRANVSYEETITALYNCEYILKEWTSKTKYCNPRLTTKPSLEIL
ncbi:hypothetical protein NPIL_384281 [Nephila pilipes]|uniref:Uncharacterized protein n=1 Tax=Nephila pilipes TaxID=299642 RepID=A0A8X6T1H6_NEPPI|nr:hypothetical protein NPIL_116221 [Nephila pilipes]GFT31851.1 hypothetical protein NPIL_384281 [Nephila pilipes]